MSGCAAFFAPERFVIPATVSELRVLLETLIPMAELGNDGFSGADVLFPAWMVISSNGPDRDEPEVLKVVELAPEAVGMHVQAGRQFGPCDGAKLSVQPGEEDKEADCLQRPCCINSYSARSGPFPGI